MGGPRYRKASRKQKRKILGEFVALTGYHRKSAIRAFTKRRDRITGEDAANVASKEPQQAAGFLLGSGGVVRGR